MIKPPESNLEQPKIVHRSQQSIKSKSQCSVSRLICTQLLILLALLVVAAITIPIIVLILDNRSAPCSSTYSDTFTNGVTPTAAQCANWQQFKTSLTCSSYSKMRFYGSKDLVGVTVSDPSVVTALVVALKYNTTVTTLSNGVYWRVGVCSSGFEISANGFCACAANYALRPCHSNSDWGGIGSPTCSSATQTLSLYFE
ncbi:unnamed protein product [Adineta ricciae]|uniref:Uncharacterized protein n=1 Tax=Adineta ricciae TaxID=249248 RepID=A0A814PYM7_ADIRI|nr:unnamed protein product [Adineta ricciae]CAF1287709.1 unnamed protein product [Adineta ricciae]